MLSNTSRCNHGTAFQFQYISCCCLSNQIVFHSHTPGKFQYISCCCLSYLNILLTLSLYWFQYISCCCLSPFTDSAITRRLRVSIHLMLLFFRVKQDGTKVDELFQYISCCCFSFFCLIITAERRVSIHLMLLFFVSNVPDLLQSGAFQYISCCCFSHDFSLFFHFIISDSPLFFKPFFVFYQPYHLPLYFPHKYVKLLVTISFFHISYISAPGKKLTHFQSPIFPC